MTKSGLLLTVIKLDGLCFQTLDQSEINSLCNGRNTTIQGLSSSKYAVYGHVIRRAVPPDLCGDFDSPFVRELNARYMAALGERRQFVNEIYLTLVRRPMRGHLGLIDRTINLFTIDQRGDEPRLQAQQDLREAASIVARDLRSYGSRILSVVRRGERGFYSEACEFIAKILNGADDLEIPLPRMPLDEYLPTRRIFFGRNTIELRRSGSSERKFASMLSIKEYPPYSGPGMLDDLLKLPHELIITQSFALNERSATLMRMNTIGRRVSGSDAHGTTVADGVQDCKNLLMQGEACFGDHHLTVMALSSTLEELPRVVSDVGAELTSKNMLWVREDLNSEPAYWAQLPGNFSYIARRALISSRNFAGFFSAHNFPSGQRTDQHWATPIALLETTSQTAYYFNFHKHDLGNFSVIGPTGSGKTVALSFLLAQSMRVKPRPRCIYFDRDRGAEIFIRAMGGRYEELSPADASGFNPFQLPDTPENRSFLVTLVSFMVREGSKDLSAEESSVVTDAIDALYDLEPTYRVLSNLYALLQGRIAPGLGDISARLQPWMKDYGWLFNNPSDCLDWSNPIAGFDMTKVLDTPAVRTAALLYIFHRLREILDGQPTIIFLDEGWRLLDDEAFVSFLKDLLKTIRKQNGVIGFGTQSASDITTSTISRTLIEQTATNIFFPNPRADDSHYRDAFRLSDKEMRFIRETPKDTRAFLIRHGQESVIVKLNLDGMPDIVRVLSGRTETVAEVAALRKEHGDTPSAWLPLFCGWGEMP